MHHAPSSLLAALTIFSLILSPFAIDYAFTLHMRRRAVRSRIAERLAAIARDHRTRR